MSNIPAKASSFTDRLKEHATGPKGLGSIVEEIRFAVADIRQKVVEEGMYGRAATPPAGIDHGSAEGIHGKSEPGGEAHRPNVLGSFAERCKEAFEHSKDAPPPEPPAPDRS